MGNVPSFLTHTQTASLHEKISVIVNACEEIKTSTKFRQLLIVVMKVAKELDSTGATGFSLST